MDPIASTQVWLRILGPLFLFGGINHLVNRERFAQIADWLFKQDDPIAKHAGESLIVFEGFCGLMFGLAILATHTPIEGDVLSRAVRTIGLAISIFGALAIMRPAGAFKRRHKFLAKDGFSWRTLLAGVGPVLLGAYLIWQGWSQH